MRPTVYLETTIISYLAARPSKDLITAACQTMTHEWWNRRRRDFELLVSERVIFEAQRGDRTMSARRLTFIDGLEVLRVSASTAGFVEKLLKGTGLPVTAVEDVFHIAVTAENRVDFLLTWNCRHIANAVLVKKVEQICAALGHKCPTICTPQELMGD